MSSAAAGQSDRPTYSGYKRTGRQHGGPQQTYSKNTRESIIDLSKYVDEKIRVKFVGGREVVGVLKGADPICNLVLDDTIEYMRDEADPYTLTGETRKLGILIARGPTVLSICKEDGFEMGIENPYV